MHCRNYWRLYIQDSKTTKETLDRDSSSCSNMRGVPSCDDLYDQASVRSANKLARSETYLETCRHESTQPNLLTTVEDGERAANFFVTVC